MLSYSFEFDNEALPSLEIDQDPSGDMAMGVGATVWDAGLILSRLLEWQSAHGEHAGNQNDIFASSLTDTISPGILWKPEKWKRIVELGSGTGLVGLVLAQLLVDHSIIIELTDRAGPLPLLRANKKKFEVKNHGAKVQILVRELDWTAIPVNMKSADLILVSDCVYDKTLFVPLLEVLNRLCHNDTMILIAYEKRDFETEAEFFKQLGDLFQFRHLHQNQFHEHWYSPDDIFVFCVRRRVGA